MRSVFQREDLWDLFDTDLALEPSNSKTDGKGKEGETNVPSDDRQKVAADLLKRRKGKAMAYLRLSVYTEIRPRIQDLEEPRVAWKNMKGAFQTNTITDIMVVLNQWESLCMHKKLKTMTYLHSCPQSTVYFAN